MHPPFTADHPEDEFLEPLHELIAISKTHGVVLSPQEEFHLSLSQTVVLRHHWIQPFTQSLRKGLLNCRRFATRMIFVMYFPAHPCKVLSFNCFVEFDFSSRYVFLFVARFACTAERLKVYCNAERTRCSQVLQLSICRLFDM